MAEGVLNGRRSWESERENKYILLSVIVVLVSVLYAVLYFRGVAERMWQSMKDLGLSAAYYVTELFLGEWLSGTITPTVQNIPSGVTQVLPGEYAGFKEKLIEFGKLLIAKENLQGFFGGIAGNAETAVTNIDPSDYSGTLYRPVEAHATAENRQQPRRHDEAVSGVGEDRG